MLFPLVTKTIGKQKLVNHLEKRGIETRDLLPLLNQPVCRGLFRGRFPVARWLLDRGFYIGCHQYLSKTQLDYVIDMIHGFFRAGAR